VVVDASRVTRSGKWLVFDSAEIAPAEITVKTKKKSKAARAGK
jgi:hypothetical protein